MSFDPLQFPPDFAKGVLRRVEREKQLRRRRRLAAAVVGLGTAIAVVAGVLLRPAHLASESRVIASSPWDRAPLPTGGDSDPGGGDRNPFH